MPHGAPDWGVVAPKRTVYILQDMAELAARLGSIVTYDRRGDVVWLDDFEDNIAKWYHTYVVAGGSAALSSEACRNGGKSAKMVTAANANDARTLARYLPPPILGKIGCEMSFALGSGLYSASLLMEPSNNNLGRIAALRYLPAAKQLQYLETIWGWQTFATTLGLIESPQAWHTLKMVINIETNKYVRAILNETSYDLRAYSIPTEVTSEAPYWQLAIQTRPSGAAAASIYIDDVIITQNEP